MNTTDVNLSPYEAFVQAAHRQPDATFLHIPASARADRKVLEVSYCAMLERIEHLATQYAKAGYGRGHRIGLLLENDPAFMAHFFALNSIGASVVPVNPDYRPSEAQYVLEHAQANLVVAFAKYADLLAEAGVKAVAEETLANLPLSSSPALTMARGRNSECALLYTSGTTGKPKGCILTNEYFLSIGERYIGMGHLCAIEPGRDRLITPLPLFHMNALAASMMAMVLSGGCIVQLDRFHPRTWWDDVRSSGATIVHYLGVMPAILLSLTPSELDRSHRVRFGFGANCDPKHQLTFEHRFGFPLVEAWAMTETGGAGSIAAVREPRLPGARCIGRPGEGLEMRLVDADDRDVGVGEPGQLVVRSAGSDPRRGFFAGYLRDEAATELAWKGGWFHTGDVLRQDADGQCFFVDRQKNIIRRSGENIAALEVEATVLELDFVQQVAVIAAPDAVRDEEVLACVRLKDGSTVDRETALRIQDHCLDKMTYFKAPGYVAFVDSLPTTVTNKVQKTRLSDFAQNPLGQPDTFDLRDRKKRTRPSHVPAPGQEV